MQTIFYLPVFENAFDPAELSLLGAGPVSEQSRFQQRERERERGGQSEAERERKREIETDREGEGRKKATARASKRENEGETDRQTDRSRDSDIHTDHLCPPRATKSMAKSSKKQCRTPKPPRQGGGLVVVSQRDILRVAKPGPSKTAKKAKGKKKKMSSNPLAELMASGDGDESDGFDTPLPSHRPCSVVAVAGGSNGFIFASAHHSREQRLYYLLATRPAPPQQPGEGGGTAGTPGGDGGVGGTGAGAGAGAAMEGGCHALVFVETTAAAQELVGELKALSLVAFALHERTPKAQVNYYPQQQYSSPYICIYCYTALTLLSLTMGGAEH